VDSHARAPMTRVESSSSTRQPASAGAAGRGRKRPHPLLFTALLAVAWALPVLTQLTSTDPLLVAVIVFATGGLLRVGATVLDRLMLTLTLLIGLAIAAGLLLSLWPWGLQPVAVGGLALTALVAAYAYTGTPPPWRTWPRRMLGSDLVLLAAFAVGARIAYGPSFGAPTGTRLAFAGMTGDRLRHFNLFDAIHRIGGYSFLKQSQATSMLDPGMLASYPPGGHYLYALADIFARSSVNPGDATGALERYGIWVALGYGFFVLAVAWAARWAAGPSLTGWRRVLLVTAIAAFLATGVFTSAIWSTWDPQVLALGLLALLAAVSLRPPVQARTHILLAASLCVAIFLTYELYAPFAAILVLVSGVVYRKRLTPHWRFAAIVAVVSIPAALSEYLAATTAGLNGATLSTAIGFTIPFSTLALAVIALLSVVGFAASAARRRPSARAGLAATVLCGLALLAFMLYQQHTIHTTSYYFPKAVQAWVVIALVGAGSAGHLLSRPALPHRGAAGAVLGLGALVLGIAATGSYWWGTPTLTRVGQDGTAWSVHDGPWASVWVTGTWIYPPTIASLTELNSRRLLGDGVPTIAVVYESASDNVNLSLQLAVLNRDAGTMSNLVNGTPDAAALAGTDGLIDAGRNGAAWSAAQRDALSGLEAGIEQSPTPVRVIVGTQPLRTALTAWSATHPDKISALLSLP
jgi:hypothetical protein